MINWISNYDYDYAIATIPIQVILLAFYGARRNLPIRQSLSFSIVMILNLVLTVVDIISCEMNAAYATTPAQSLYFVNIIYFLTFITKGWTLFYYTAEACREYKILNLKTRLLAAFPAILTCVLVLITPWAKTIFTIGANGYENCFLYNTIYICTYFYIAATYICIFSCYKRMHKRIRIGLLAYNTILFIGLIFRKVFYGKYLVTSYVNLLAILIIYITSENPDLYRDQRIKLFNKDAFDIIGLNYLHQNKTFHCVIASIYNFDTIKVLYNTKQLDASIKKIGENILRSSPDYYAFYFGSGKFLMLKKGEINSSNGNYINDFKRHFFTYKEERIDIPFGLATMAIPYDVFKDNINQINDLLDFVYAKAYSENQKGNYIFNEVMFKELDRQKAVESALRKAIENHTLKAFYQPIFSTRHERIIGAEALARLFDEKIGYIPPIEFISIAEKNGDIMEVGRQIFEQVCEFAEKEKLQERGIEFINVNLSPSQCLNAMLAEEFKEIATRHNISMNMIDFEITESTAEDFLSIQKQMYLLQKEGAELSLDDFGTGTSNLTRLMNLPIHVVKIDMDVVSSYFNKEAPYLPDLIKMFQHANMKIVVEGIETKQMKDALMDMECDYLQGFYFSRALPDKDFIQFIEINKNRGW